MKILLLLIMFSLYGCATTCEPELKTVTQIERVVVKPPAELLVIPAQDMPINVDTATQRTVAEWILKSEKRMQQMEDSLKALRKWSDETK